MVSTRLNSVNSELSGDYLPVQFPFPLAVFRSRHSRFLPDPDVTAFNSLRFSNRGNVSARLVFVARDTNALAVFNRCLASELVGDDMIVVDATRLKPAPAYLAIATRPAISIDFDLCAEFGAH